MKMYVYNGKNKQYIVNMHTLTKTAQNEATRTIFEYQNSSEERRGDEVCKCWKDRLCVWMISCRGDCHRPEEVKSSHGVCVCVPPG